MARGAPDYSNVLSQEAIYTLLDLGELAARLGSIDVFDRSGNLVWMDDFEAPTLNWLSDTAGTGASVTLSTAYRLRGAQSCLLTAGSDDGIGAIIARYLSLPNLSPHSFEIAFYPDTHIAEITWYIYHVEADVRHQYGIRYSQAAATLSYYNSAGGWTVFTSSVTLLGVFGIFEISKLTVDLTTGKYKRFRLNHTTYDLSSAQSLSVADPISDYLRVSVEVVGTAATNALCYVDNALVKQNEP
jgi:hypothetical protein